MRCASGMNTTRVAASFAFSAALACAGIQLGQHFLPKLRGSLPTVQQLAVVALAVASEAKDAHAKDAPQIAAPAKVAAENGLPDPVGAGPADVPEASASAAAPAAVEFEITDVMSATEQKIVQATLTGNGREHMTAHLRNNSPTPLRVTIPAGQVLESGRSRVVVVRTAEAELMPAQSADIKLVTAALLSSNTVADAPYRLSYSGADRVAAFLAWTADHQELSAAAIQTAVLALTENLPLNAVAKFASANGTAGTLGTDAFRVETGDIIAALSALRASGVGMETIAMTVDPQLRIEAMIEPLSREAAKRYFGISEEREWDFWKHELLEGNPTTRHYALFGIARFYPDIALQMLPKWAREAQTHPVYRTAAVQALADTQRAEALPILRQIAAEVGPQTELGKTAMQAAAFLDRRLTDLATRPQVVAFRGKERVSGL